MINIRPVSDLRNNFTEIESIVKQGDPVYLTKNGYGTMVVMDLQQYAALTDDIELKLDEADKAAEADDKRYTCLLYTSARCDLLPFGRSHRHDALCTVLDPVSYTHLYGKVRSQFYLKN